VGGEIGGSPKKVLHVLAKSVPELNGYSIRGHELITAQMRTRVVDPLVLTSPYYPDLTAMGERVTVDGVRYLRSMPIGEGRFSPLGMRLLSLRGLGEDRDSGGTNQKNRETSGRGRLFRIGRFLSYPLRAYISYIDERLRMGYFKEVIKEVIAEENPDIVHAHTPFKVGLPAMKAARESGKPFVYEVRGLWEESAIVRGKFSKWGMRYWRFRKLEERTMIGADAVFCISEKVKSDLIGRGVQEEKIVTIPNGAPSAYLSGNMDGREKLGANEERHLTVLEEIGRKKKVIGYMGNIQQYEGLEILIRSIKQILAGGDKVHLLIVSNDGNIGFLKSLSEKEGIDSDCTIIGPISRQGVPHFYNCMDLVVIPRLGNSRMAELVTPLKPLEALALGIPLVISDTPAIREIVSVERATLFESGNLADLSEKITRVLADDEGGLDKAEKGKKWVLENATWEISAQKTIEAYGKLL